MQQWTSRILGAPITGWTDFGRELLPALVVFLVALIFIVWGWPLVKFGLLQESEMAELPMIFIYAAWPVAGITWVIFQADRLVDHLALWRGEQP